MYDLKKIIENLPKAELHLHIEGTFEPELMFKIAKRNKIKIKYKNVGELKKAYKFSNLQDFLDIYYEGCKVLIKKKDFYDLTFEYFLKAKKDNVRHCEIFFDPQTHTDRGIKFEIVLNGIYEACLDAKKKLNISSKIILSILRHLDEKKGIEILKEGLKKKNREKIFGVGLDSSEKNNPPKKFKKLYQLAKKNKLELVAHCGEEGPSEYIWNAIKILKVKRCDHGNSCIKDRKLLDFLAKKKIGLTMCPLSNLKLKVVKNLVDHPLKKLMKKNILVTINSDDPAYFGGYINKNYEKISEALNLSKKDIIKLAKNSFEISFLSKKEKEKYFLEIDGYVE